MQLPFLGTTQDTSRFLPETHIHVNLPSLQQYIPEKSAEYILGWFQLHPVKLKLSKYRSSKSGDYMASLNKLPARISVNKNLNKFDFLITLVHEMAHHEVWIETIAVDRIFEIQRIKNRPRPHGKEWKTHYRQLMEPLMNESIFPAGVLHHLTCLFDQPFSGSKAKKNLMIELNKYDAPDDYVFIDSLEFNTLFELPAGRTFRKLGRLRKRYRCLCLNNRRIYLFSPLVRVYPLPI